MGDRASLGLSFPLKNDPSPAGLRDTHDRLIAALDDLYSRTIVGRGRLKAGRLDVEEPRVPNPTLPIVVSWAGPPINPAASVWPENIRARRGFSIVSSDVTDTSEVAWLFRL